MRLIKESLTSIITKSLLDENFGDTTNYSSKIKELVKEWFENYRNNLLDALISVDVKTLTSKDEFNKPIGYKVDIMTARRGLEKYADELGEFITDKISNISFGGFEDIKSQKEDLTSNILLKFNNKNTGIPDFYEESEDPDMRIEDISKATDDELLDRYNKLAPSVAYDIETGQYSSDHEELLRIEQELENRDVDYIEYGSEINESEDKAELLSKVFARYPDMSEEDEDLLNSLSYKELVKELKNRDWYDKLDEEVREYRYITNHGVGPGTLPDNTFVRSEELDYGKTAIYTNRPLTKEELSYYDIKSENIQEAEEGTSLVSEVADFLKEVDPYAFADDYDDYEGLLADVKEDADEGYNATLIYLAEIVSEEAGTPEQISKAQELINKIKGLSEEVETPREEELEPKQDKSEIENKIAETREALAHAAPDEKEALEQELSELEDELNEGSPFGGDLTMDQEDAIYDYVKSIKGSKDAQDLKDVKKAKEWSRIFSKIKSNAAKAAGVSLNKDNDKSVEYQVTTALDEGAKQSFVAVYWRSNPQLKNGGYYKAKKVYGTDLESVKKALESKKDSSAYGSMSLDKVVTADEYDGPEIKDESGVKISKEEYKNIFEAVVNESWMSAQKSVEDAIEMAMRDDSLTDKDKASEFLEGIIMYIRDFAKEYELSLSEPSEFMEEGTDYSESVSIFNAGLEKAIKAQETVNGEAIEDFFYAANSALKMAAGKYHIILEAASGVTYSYEYVNGTSFEDEKSTAVSHPGVKISLVKKQYDKAGNNLYKATSKDKEALVKFVEEFEPDDVDSIKREVDESLKESTVVVDTAAGTTHVEGTDAIVEINSDSTVVSTEGKTVTKDASGVTITEPTVSGVSPEVGMVPTEEPIHAEPDADNLPDGTEPQDGHSEEEENGPIVESAKVKTTNVVKSQGPVTMIECSGNKDFKYIVGENWNPETLEIDNAKTYAEKNEADTDYFGRVGVKPEEVTESAKVKKYYKLDTDNYGQPSGQVEEISKEEYDRAKESKTPYIFDNYEDALRRAQD